MKKYFMTGLAILLPIILTMMIVGFLINFVTKPFLEFTKALLENLIFFQQPFFILNETTLIAISSKILILSLLIGFIISVGLVGKLFLIDAFFRLGSYCLHNLPFINKIYKTCQDAVHTLFSSSKSFSQVVLVPFPNSHSLSIGLVTGDFYHFDPTQSQKLISVFVPGTPNPSVGFMLMLKKEQLILVNMKVDEAMKFIISCGIVMPNFSIIQDPATIYEQFSSHLLSSERQLSKN